MFADIHSHMLFDVDDGAEKFEVTKEMITMSYSQGCRTIFLTPHADSFDYSELRVRDKFNKVNKWVKEKWPDLNIYLGCEIYLDTKVDIQKIIRKLEEGIYPTLNNTKYVLVEFSLRGFDTKEALRRLKEIIASGYIPVIAHVERYGKEIADIKAMKDLGCMIQVNIGNVFNPARMSAMLVANELIKERIVDFVGTDSHGMDWRPPVIDRYIKYLYKCEEFDNEYIERILYKNVNEYLIKH